MKFLKKYTSQQRVTCKKRKQIFKSNWKIQLNFYKLNHHYPGKNFQVKQIKPDRISLQDASAVLRLIENPSNRSSNYRSSTIFICDNKFITAIYFFISLFHFMNSVVCEYVVNFNFSIFVQNLLSLENYVP